MNYHPIRYDFETFKKRFLADGMAQKEYGELEEEFMLITEMIHARKKAMKTQKEVATIMQTTSSVISRLESIPPYKKRHSPTVETLKKYAHSVGCKLSIKLIPLKSERHSEHFPKRIGEEDRV
jgi:transcriptional regulator with XRE-family HTH domain